MRMEFVPEDEVHRRPILEALYTNVMLPVVAEIIHVFELFVGLEAKVRESDLIGTIGEADAALGGPSGRR